MSPHHSVESVRRRQCTEKKKANDSTCIYSTSTESNKIRHCTYLTSKEAAQIIHRI